MNLKGIVLFDIDGVIRDVSRSYRLAIQETVEKFCDWRPTNKDIDSLKAEGLWNNDWDASHELITRQIENKRLNTKIPSKEIIIESFSNFYFGNNPSEEAKNWNGFIKNEELLVNKDFFMKLSNQNYGWGFVSGAELPSAKYVLEVRIGLQKPPLVAMGDAPDKPDPTGLIELSRRLLSQPLGQNSPPITYLGDTVTDVETIQRARRLIPKQTFTSLAVIPPHLNDRVFFNEKLIYEKQLKRAGADEVLNSTSELISYLQSK